MTTLLHHISDCSDIARFDPRPAPVQVSGQQGLEGAMVWAVDSSYLHNYLLPRDCPRVTFYALPTSAPEDVERLMAGTNARCVSANESRWLPEVLRTTLYRYDFASDPFVSQDLGAGYYIAREPILPVAVTPIPDLLAALLEYKVELRIMPSLWGLRDRVVASTLQYSTFVCATRNRETNQSEYTVSYYNRPNYGLYSMLPRRRLKNGYPVGYKGNHQTYSHRICRLQNLLWRSGNGDHFR